MQVQDAVGRKLMRNENDIANNAWENRPDANEVLKFIAKISDNNNHEWSWARNSKCKYVSVRFDMRDGGFVLLDRNGSRITFEQLKYQYGIGENDG